MMLNPRQFSFFVSPWSISTRIVRVFALPIAMVAMLGDPLLAQRGGREPAEQKEESQEKIYSGPQADEPLPEVPVWVHAGSDSPSEKVDLAKLSHDSPIAIAFMHEKSRPAFGLMRLMSAFAEKKKDKELQLYCVVLTEDRSSTEKWLGQINRYFNAPTKLAVADGGIEGPGSLGLNRLVSMTILVAKEGKVTANFALTQVSDASDGPKVLKAMNDAIGGGEIPKLEELLPRYQGQRMRRAGAQSRQRGNAGAREGSGRDSNESNR